MIKIIIENDVIAAAITASEETSTTELISDMIVPALQLAGYHEDSIRDAMRKELE